MWRSRFVDFSGIRTEWDYADAPPQSVPAYLNQPPYRYDWEMFKQQQETAYLSRICGEIGAIAPGAPIQLVTDETLFETGKAMWRIDPEAEARIMSIMGSTAAASSQNNGRLSVSFPLPSMYVELQRSIAPDKPVFATDLQLRFDAGLYAGGRYGFVRTLLCEAAIRGANAVALHAGVGAHSIFDLSASPFAYPECLEAAGVASLDLNRLADTLSAMQEAPAEIALLWSLSSKIYKEGAPYLESLTNAYEGCSYFGLKVRFITEQQCVENGLEGIRLLILPDTPCILEPAYKEIVRFVEAGGALIRPVRPTIYQERGITRHIMLEQTSKTILVDSGGGVKDYLHAVDVAYAQGFLEKHPHLVNELGYPFDGVVSRAVNVNGVEYLYVANLRNAPLQAGLADGAVSGFDVLNEEPVSFPLLLEPLYPRLIRFDELPESQPSATEEEASAQASSKTASESGVSSSRE